MKRKLLCLALTLVMIMGGSASVFASASVAPAPPEGAVVQPAGDTYEVITDVKTERKNMLFVGYLKQFPEWAKVIQYQVNSGTTVTATGSYTYEGIGISLSFSLTNTGTRTILADAAKYSRLGGYMDVTFTKKEHKRYTGGILVSTYYTVTQKIHNKYINVVYKISNYNS